MPKSRNRKEQKKKANARKEKLLSEKKKQQKDIQRYMQSMRELQEQNNNNIVELENVGKDLNLDFNDISSVETTVKIESDPIGNLDTILPYVTNVDDALITDAIIIEENIIVNNE